jgi:hypothetical protein
VQRVSDDEVVLRRIPSSAPWFEPPDSISSMNFKLGPGHHGLSVYRNSVVTPADVLSKAESIPGSFVVAARVGDIRGLQDAVGRPLGLDVIAVDDEHDAGHAEIRAPGKLSKAASNALKRIFKPVVVDLPKQERYRSRRFWRRIAKPALSGWRACVRCVRRTFGSSRIHLLLGT